MKSYRLRRLVVAALGAATAVSGVAIASATPAAAAGPNVTTVAGSQPFIPGTATNQNVGTETITIPAGAVYVGPDTITLTVSDSAANLSVTFAATPSVTNPNVSGNPGMGAPSVSGMGSAMLIIHLNDATGGTATNSQVITVSGITYTTASASPGPVTVLTSGTPTGVTYPSVQPGATNAIIVGTPTATLAAASPTPQVLVGGNNQHGANLTVQLSSQGSGWFNGDKVVLTTGVTCSGGGATQVSAGFSSAPVATPTTTSGQVSTAPTVSPVTLSSTGSCVGYGVNNTASFTFTNSGAITGPNGPGTTAPATVTLSGIAYNIGGGTTPGSYITVTGTYNTVPMNGGGSVNDAQVTALIVTGNNPPVGLLQSAVNQPISNVVLTESGPGTVPTGYVCVTINGGDAAFNTSSATPAAAASGGGATVGPVSSVNSSHTLVFPVVTQSSGAPATFTLSNINVNAGTNAGTVTANVIVGSSVSCSGGTLANGQVPLFGVSGSVVGSNRIYGQTADGTAAAIMGTSFYPNNSCPGYDGSPPLVPPSRPVVLTTDQNFPDALTASYAAGQLGTGILLTPTASLSADTITALRLQGITNVYVVGGPLAVSNAVITQLQSTPAYFCGGTVPLTTFLGAPQNLAVTQIYGQTLYDTAQAVAQYFGPGAVGTAAYPGAYPATATASGMYNDTTGLGGTATSSVPTTSMKTAILATGQTFPDAMAVSVAGYHGGMGGGSNSYGFPVLLTQQGSLSPQAQAAILNLGIQQVVVMGGPIAISNAVVTQLQGMGVYVLRIAGQDFTDTAQLLAQFEMNNASGQGLGWNTNSYGFIVARGDFYADALTGSSLDYGTGCGASPILLTVDPNTVGAPLTSFLNQAGDEYGASTIPELYDTNTITFLGGPIAITPATAAAVLAALSI